MSEKTRAQAAGKAGAKEKKLRLKVITPTEIKVDENVDMVIFRAINGDMGVMPNHQEAVAILDDGILRIIDGGTERVMAVFGGLAKVADNEVKILTRSAQWPEDIDRAQAERDRVKAELLLKERTDDMLMKGYQVSLRRALVRIEVSSYPAMSKMDDE